MAKNKSLEKRSQKQSSKSTAPPSETHAAHSRTRVTKKSASSLSPPRSRRVSTRNPSRATKHKVTIDVPDESVNDEREEYASSSEGAENFSMEEDPELAVLSADVAKLKRKISAKRRVSAIKRLPALDEELKSLHTVETLAPSRADPGHSGRSVDSLQPPPAS